MDTLLQVLEMLFPNTSTEPVEGDKASDTTSKSSHHRLTPLDYANAVANFAQLTSGEGAEYQRLADFLALLNHTSSDAGPSVNKSKFASLYSFPHQSVTDQTSHSREPEVRHFTSADDFSSYETSSAEGPRSQVLFLKGFPSFQWLGAIGAKYEVDPEFFRHHLDFGTSRHRSNAYSSPSLPSSSWHLIRLPIFTIANQHAEPQTNKTFRQEAVKALSAHHHKLHRAMANGDTQYVGASIIRDYHIFSARHFIIEQKMTVCLQHFDKAYIMLVWLDSTQQFSTDEIRSWCPSSADGKSLGPEYVPVIQHRHSLGLKSHLISRIASIKDDGKETDMPLQTAALLNINYATTLHSNIICFDAFYALSELFRFCMSSISQVVNLINKEMDVSTRDDTEDVSVPDLRYAANVMYSILQRIDEVQQGMKNTSSPKWPKDTTNSKKRVELVYAGLQADYTSLRQRSSMLHDRCNNVIGVIMNAMAVRESREATVQAKRFGKLTLIAFIFVPLSFTTSLFGMNVREFEPMPSIWAWIVTAVPVLFVALLFFYVENWRRSLRKLLFRANMIKTTPERHA